jgi:hypothetical protein
MEGKAGRGRGGGSLPLMAGGPSGLKDGKGNGRGFWVGSNCLNWHAHGEEKGRGGGGGKADSAGVRRRPAGAGKKKGREGKGADRWDPPVGAAVKKKRGRGERWAGGEVGLGRLGQIEPGALLFFFLFLFQTAFSNPFSTQIQIKLLQTFLKNFIDFRDHTSNQKPCKPKDDAHTLVVSKFIKLSLIFLEPNLNSNLISLNP